MVSSTSCHAGAWVLSTPEELKSHVPWDGQLHGATPEPAYSEPVSHSWRAWNPHDATRILYAATETQHSPKMVLNN